MCASRIFASLPRSLAVREALTEIPGEKQGKLVQLPAEKRRGARKPFSCSCSRPKAGPAQRAPVRLCPRGPVGARVCSVRMGRLQLALRREQLLRTRYARVTHCRTVPRSEARAASFERDCSACNAVPRPCASASCGSVGARHRGVRICGVQLASEALAPALRARHALQHCPSAGSTASFEHDSHV